jgi:protein gp37
MGDNTAIEWSDATWNPTAGCSLVSPGCTNCYAMRVAHRLARMPEQREFYAGMTQESKAGPVWTGSVRLIEKALDRPLHWTRPRRIFVNSMSDLFHEALPYAAIDKVFAVMALAPQHTFQVLTKRAERMRDYVGGFPDRRAIFDSHSGLDYVTWPLPNVWLGVSVEDQERADERIPHLLATPAAVRFLSCEPLLGPIEFSDVSRRSDAIEQLGRRALAGIGWVIAGGESGPNARPMHPDWARSLRDQCAAAGVAFFFKQWGEYAPATAVGETWRHPEVPQRVGKKRAGRLLDGRTHDEFPDAPR